MLNPSLYSVYALPASMAPIPNIMKKETARQMGEGKVRSREKARRRRRDRERGNISGQGKTLINW